MPPTEATRHLSPLLQGRGGKLVLKGLRPLHTFLLAQPLFPEDFHAETFVNVTLMSAESDTPPDALAGLAASAALAVSDVPFHGPIAEARVARVDGQLVVNPTFSQLQEADIEIIVGATLDNILMVEGEMKEVSLEEAVGSLKTVEPYKYETALLFFS